MKKNKEILSIPPNGFWKRLKWETIDCWRDWLSMIFITFILIAAIILQIGQYQFYQNLNKAINHINNDDCAQPSNQIDP